jgi:hypothetical protein
MYVNRPFIYVLGFDTRPHVLKTINSFFQAMLYAPRPYEKCSSKKKNGFVLAAANRQNLRNYS